VPNLRQLIEVRGYLTDGGAFFNDVTKLVEIGGHVGEPIAD
jgi:hypothetical protein